MDFSQTQLQALRDASEGNLKYYDSIRSNKSGSWRGAHRNYPQSTINRVTHLIVRTEYTPLISTYGLNAKGQAVWNSLTEAELNQSVSEPQPEPATEAVVEPPQPEPEAEIPPHWNPRLTERENRDLDILQDLRDRTEGTPFEDMFSDEAMDWYENEYLLKGKVNPIAMLLTYHNLLDEAQLAVATLVKAEKEREGALTELNGIANKIRRNV